MMPQSMVRALRTDRRNWCSKCLKYGVLILLEEPEGPKLGRSRVWIRSRHSAGCRGRRSILPARPGRRMRCLRSWGVLLAGAGRSSREKRHLEGQLCDTPREQEDLSGT